ncbi:thiol-disulfide oxidoreductase DCC family protein [Urechidicola vernalis]|uniref:Thiol-disulfide oxidoreductase DCC family protein n=1 Tax=Urechidicola vernalis TaxID=3075600 RepID=A0ABU2Y0N9_9FLAO|nr:thiol-disulfide oxidoreductase DCC family protein [Urechidicola sp. P050]MDT0551737.1 thiol-disulfide oxidoreductase DCC family protein [Urechidicola sp. P050]
MKKITPQPLILFDGICNLCNSSVQFVLKKDKNKQFIFASIQSDAAKEILLQFSKNNSDLGSIFLIHKDHLYTKSSAILRIGKLLGRFYSLAIIFWVVPKPIRNWVYDYIAKNRYKWYGKKDECMIPTPEIKSRFLN